LIVVQFSVPVELMEHQLTHPSTELGGLAKFGCSIDGKFYTEGAQVIQLTTKKNT